MYIILILWFLKLKSIIKNKLIFIYKLFSVKINEIQINKWKEKYKKRESV